jgi:ATP-dependent exoDNAse (exonuclease V) alpha subunit
MTARVLPFRHLSIRVPWHDAGWNGTICKDPLNNGSCLRLSRIAEERDDEFEVAHAGMSWSELPQGSLPPCHAERAGFMSPTSRRVLKEHPYAVWNPVYAKFEPTWFEIPAYAADCVPFRWMLREHAAGIVEELQVDYEPRLEEQVDAEAELHDPAWIQHERNQRAMLDTFFSAVQPGLSLCFFYAKETPLSDDHRRVLIGVGRVDAKSAVVPYGNQGGGFGSVLWERMIEHSIRPTMEDGFLLPYHQLLEQARRGILDPADYVVHVPDEFADQFSYASEHVSHDAALSLLLALADSVERFSTQVEGSWDHVRGWLSDRIGEVWDARGPFPGLGSALTAFGVEQGVLLSYSIQQSLGDSEQNPWDTVDEIFRHPQQFPDLAVVPSAMLCKSWAAMPDTRRDLLKLLSRFDLTIAQATRMYQPTERSKAGLDVADAELLANPYRIFEADRSSLDPVSVTTVDRGVFPPDRIRADFPLPEPTMVQDALDERRVRALTIEQLERAAKGGDSLVAQPRLIQAIRDEPLDPPCPLSEDILSVAESYFDSEVEFATMAGGARAYQLTRLAAAKKAISRLVQRRAGAKPLAVEADWRATIDQLLGDSAADDPDEPQAREEKAAALQVLARSRISVLIGPAGTGKTTLLRALCSLPAVDERGVLLLAPTGKARVRMNAAIKRKAFTLAQLLLRSGRYNPDTGAYQRSDQDRTSGYGTVIVDECSMLTEEQLDALLDSIEGYDRLILVGDPRQLPPIGVGRPFVDIVEHLRSEAGVGGFPLVGTSYAELTIKRRQLLTATADDERADMVLADWFSGAPVPPGADAIWDDLARERDLNTLSIRQWSTSKELHDLLRAELATSLAEMADPDDATGFQSSYGGRPSGDHVYFNIGSAERVESWQVLSPVRAEGGGVNELNRLLQRTYRSSTLALANEPVPWKQKIPQPAGPQEIVYGDKVINVRNKSRKRFWPEVDDALAYVANGEIGVVTGPFRRKGSRTPLKVWEVEFSTQPGLAYKYWKSELGNDDGNPILELAYAITVHKSQGSEFGTTFVVIPSPCRLLSRELLYTALTRQQDRVVLFMQGDLADLRSYAFPKHSEALARITNLFGDPKPIEIDGKFMEEGLIHHTRKGISVRSKSEVIIADLLYSKDVEFVYESELVLGGKKRFPDFTIEDADTGETYYWEHLGMLNKASYRRKWEQKLQWYKENGIIPRGTGAGESPSGTLIITKDGANGSISSAEIEALVDELLT